MIKVTKLRAFIAGSTLGGSVCGLLLLLGVVKDFLPPKWQVIAFGPGYVSGYAFYDHCGGWFVGRSSTEAAAKLVGILAVGVWYGLIAMGISILVNRVANRRRDRKSRSESS